MADAKITLGLSPREFDLLRSALTVELNRAKGVADDRHTDLKIRHDERARAVELGILLEKLQ